LRHIGALRHKAPDFLNGLDGYIVIDAGKRFSYVERFSMAIEIAMIVRREARIAS